MKIRSSIVVLLFVVAAVRGDGPIINRDCTKTTCPPSRYCCPDDYCARPLPCASPSARGCRDDYCPNPLPCIACPPKYCGPDDYCPKYFPTCLPASLRPWFTCGPSACGKCEKK